MSGNGPAFPVPDGEAADQGVWGLSKRDLIAAMAMQGLLASGPHDSTRIVLVADAVALADTLLAMLAAGERDDG